MSNSAAKVGDIFREAGTAFNKLSEMTLMLQPTEDSPTGKWSEEEVELLRGCVNRFAVELNKISSHIKNRTMSQLMHLLEMDSGKIHVVSNPPPQQQHQNFCQLQPQEQHPEVILQLYQQGYHQNHQPLQINNQQLYYQEQAHPQLQKLEQRQYQNHPYILEQQQQQHQSEQQILQQQQQINFHEFDNNINIDAHGFPRDFKNVKELIRYFNPKEVSMKPPEKLMAGDEDDADFNDGADSMNAMLGIPAIIKSLEQDTETSQGIGTLHAEMQLNSAMGGNSQQIRQNMVSIEEHFNMHQVQQTWYHASVGPAIETEQCMVDGNNLYIPFYYENLHPISFIQVSDPAEVANILPTDNVTVSAERPCKTKTEADPTPSTGAFSSIFKNKSQHQNVCLPSKELETTSIFPIYIHPENEKPDINNVIFPSLFTLLNKYITSNDTCIIEKKEEAPADKVTKRSKNKKIAKPGSSSSNNSVCSTGKKKKIHAETLTKTDEIQIKKNTYPRPLSWLDKYITKKPASSTGTKMRKPAFNETPPASPGPFSSLFNTNSDLANHSVVIEHGDPLDMLETETYDNNFNKLYSNEQMPSDDNTLSSNQPVVLEQASSVANECRTSELQLLETPVHQLARPSVDPTNSLVQSTTEHTQGHTRAQGTQAYKDLNESVPKKRCRKKEIVTTPGPVTRSQTRRMRTD